MGAQKNHLNETVLLSTQNTCLNYLMYKKIITFLRTKFVLSEPRTNYSLNDMYFQIKESMYNANREHKATLSRMEQKFFEEKVRHEVLEN